MTDKSTIRFDLLRNLYGFLMALPEAQFNLNSVVDEEGLQTLIEAGRPKECGAVACAIGWASLMPEFRSMGLAWHPKVGLKLNDRLIAYDTAANNLFGLPEYTSEPDHDGEHEHYRERDYYAEWLFAPAGDGSMDEEIKDEHGSIVMEDHRLLFETRMRLFFEHFGEVLVLPAQADSQL